MKKQDCVMGAIELCGMMASKANDMTESSNAQSGLLVMMLAIMLKGLSVQVGDEEPEFSVPADDVYRRLIEKAFDLIEEE